MRHLELFAGIGGFRRALDLVGRDLHIPMECVGFSEIDKNAKKTYRANFNLTPQEVDMDDIVSFTSVTENIHNLPDFDLLTAGFPCQSFSNSGWKDGFNDTRGTLFFEIARILKDCQPKYFLLENINAHILELRTATEKDIKNNKYITIDNIFISSKSKTEENPILKNNIDLKVKETPISNHNKTKNTYLEKTPPSQ